MPRMARKSLGTSFFHIMVQGLNKNYIFDNDNYKEKYIYDLNKYKNECNVQLLAYCIMDNHAHLLLYAEKIEDMSKFMHFVNSSYSNYYNKVNNRVGYVFRDRYKSEPIYKEQYLLNCINYIHMNPVQAGIIKEAEKYKYSSCEQYMNNTGISKSKILCETLGIINYREIFNNITNKRYFMDIDINEDEKTQDLIEEYQKEKNKTLENIIKDKYLMKDLIIFLHNENNIKYVDIARILNISKTKMFKIKK